MTKQPRKQLPEEHRPRRRDVCASALVPCALQDSYTSPEHHSHRKSISPGLMARRLQKKNPSALGEAPGSLACRRSAGDLKRQPPTNLPVARQLLRRGFPKVAVGQVLVKARKVNAIEKIKELKPQLQHNPLGDVRVLVEVHICFREIRRTERIGLFVSLTTQRWR